jgi:hypothetical protein
MRKYIDSVIAKTQNEKGAHRKREKKQKLTTVTRH